MSSVNTPAGLDQADGLRTLFGDVSNRIICLACALDPDTVVHVGHRTAQALKNAGQRTLMIDEVPLSDRKTMSGFLYPTKYDLGQVFINSVALSKSLRQIEENLWYATSAKLRHFFEERRAKLPNLDDRLKAIQLEFDYILFATNDPEFNILNFFGQSIHRILIASPEFESLSMAMNMLRQFSIYRSDMAIPVLILGGSEEEGQAAFEKLRHAAKEAMSIDLEMLGWIKAIKASRVIIDPEDFSVSTPTEGPANEFVLPTGFFKSIVESISN
jgi:hypothetical protein